MRSTSSASLLLLHFRRWQPWQSHRCLPHVAFGRRWCVTGTAPPPTVDQLVAWQAAASEAFQQGEFAAAIENWEAARAGLQQQREQHLRESPSSDLVVILNNLACAYGEMGQLERKLELLEETLTLVGRLFGPTHPQYAITLYNLAAARGDSGDFDKMRRDLLEAESIYTAKFGAEHVKVARVLLLLADAHEALRDFAAQRTVMERALKVIMRHCGQDHPQTAVALSAMGKALGNLGDKKGKLQMIERALAIEQRRFGDEHPQLTMTLNNLALAHGELGEFEMKKFHLERAIEAQKRSQTIGAAGTHALLATTYCNYANVFGELGDLQSQLKWSKFALRYAMDHLGMTHPQVPVALNNCAATYLALGDPVGAQKVALSAREQLDAARSSTQHPERLRAEEIIVRASKELEGGH